jgi:glycosyltransferase involved in cell wall biosynthesis
VSKILQITNEQAEEISKSTVVIIPTRNRPHLLEKIVDDVFGQTEKPGVLIIVDSSDTKSHIEQRSENSIQVHHLYTNIQSAAIQRNLGLEFFYEHYSHIPYVAFLDDDVRILPQYIETLTNFMGINAEYVGVSGIALGEEKKKFRNWATDLIGLTGEEGEITKAAVNIPVRYKDSMKSIDVSWLMGCSIWKASTIEQTRFESEFLGASIFEDVIFSYSVMKKCKMKLAVLPSLTFEHELSPIGRPADYQYFSEWMSNRIVFQRLFPNDFPAISFYICNFAIGLLFVLSGMVRGFSSTKSGIGIIHSILRSVKRS